MLKHRAADMPTGIWHGSGENERGVRSIRHGMNGKAEGNGLVEFAPDPDSTPNDSDAVSEIAARIDF
jgi:hypothetical protein